MMRSDKFKAYKLRMAGRSYNEIGRLLKVPKSTLSSWFSDIALPEEASDRLRDKVHAASLRGLLARNKNQTLLAETRSKLSRQAGQKLIGKLSKRDLLLIGTALYWAEGTKKDFSLSNTDPYLVKVFVE